MGHRVTIINQQLFESVFPERMIRDFVDMFYRWEDAEFRVICVETGADLRRIFNPKLRTTVRGVHHFENGTHRIGMVRANIVRAFEEKCATGGNIVAPSVQVAYGTVFAHELQHANQVRLHPVSSRSSFWTDHRYTDRACERDARAFVDSHIDEICAYFGLPPMRIRKRAVRNDPAELQAVISLIEETSYAVTMDDIREELRASGILDPINALRVRRALEKAGIEIEN